MVPVRRGPTWRDCGGATSGNWPANVSTSLGTVFGAADTAFTTVRSHEETHPAVGRCLDRLMEPLRAYWSEYGDLAVTLEPMAVVLCDKIVHQSDSIGAHAWYPFYASGIRELTLRSGMPRAEVLALLQVGNQYRGLREQDFVEDDVVTAIWELNFQFLELGIAPTYAEDVEKAADVVKRVRRQCEEAMQQISSSAVPLPVPITENDRLRWAAGLCTENNASFRYVEALLVALQGQPPAHIHERLCDLISMEIGMAIDAGMFGVAQQILSFLDSRKDLLEKSLDSRLVLLLLETYSKTVADGVEEPVETILLRCGHHARLIIDTALTMAPNKMRRLLSCAVVYGEAAAICARDMLWRASDATAEHLVGMVGKIPGAISREALLVATEHDFYRVRGLAYQTLFEDPTVPPDRDMILRTLDDEHSLVRQCALEYLAEARPKEAREWLETQADSFDFNNWDNAEQKRLYATLAAVAGLDLVPWLEAKLSKTNLKFYNSTDAERICAITALTELRATSSRPLLEKMSKSWLSSKVREAAKRALELLDAPPPARTSRRRTFGTTWGDAAYVSGPPVVVMVDPESATPEAMSAAASGPLPIQREVVVESRRAVRERSSRRTDPPPMGGEPQSFNLDQTLDESTPPPIEAEMSTYSYVASRDSRRARARRLTEQEGAEEAWKPPLREGSQRPSEPGTPPARVKRETVPQNIKSGDSALGRHVYVSTKPRNKRGTRAGSEGGGDPRND